MKRVLCLLLTACLLFLLAPAAAARPADTEFRQIQTSLCPENTLTLAAENNRIRVSGTLSTGFSDAFWLRAGVGNAVQYYEVIPGKPFTIYLSLANVRSAEPVKLYTCPTRYGNYRSFLWHSVYVEPTGSSVHGDYRLQTSPVLTWNQEHVTGWLNPADGLRSNIPAAVQTVSDSVTQGASTDYDKILLLYEWVTDNIYYDYEAYENGKQSFTDPEEVLEERRAVCQGYASLLQSLIQAQGIPCIQTDVYALGASTTGSWTPEYAAMEQSNHICTEAWVDGRWICMDVLWDCTNRYEGGEFVSGADDSCSLYFDMTPEMFACNHKLIRRDVAAPEDTPSDWAREEVMAALQKDYVPLALQSNYRTSITRQEFCTMIMTMLCAKKNMTLDQYLKSRHVTLKKNPFTDTKDLYVQAACALGIVNGRGDGIFDPNSGITRQEAATMLTRAARGLGVTANRDPMTFADSDDFAFWAEDSIAFITALAGWSGTLVMAGTGEDRFSPLDDYTREQSILTVYRLANCF